jgi:3-hydroxyisobutyrate dehydrogenase
MTTVAVFGTGIMGSAMARRLLAHGFKVRAWNRTRARAEPLAERGAEVMDSPRAAAIGADVLLTILSDGPAIEAAMTGPDGALAGAARGTLWLQMSTVGVAPCARLSALATGAGLVFVDAPVMGTKDPAERGEITILASGPTDAEGRARPIFEKLGKKILWLGEAGAGSRMKLVGNSWVTGMTTALSETITFARALGVDPKTFMEMITGGPLDSAYAQLKGGYMIAGQFPPSFPLRLALKDVRLILESARAAGVNLPVTTAVERSYTAALEKGHGDEDMAAVIKALDSRVP